MENKNKVADIGNIKQDDVTLPIVQETTLGRKGSQGKVYYSIAWADAMVTAVDGKGNKVVDIAASGANLIKFAKGFDSLVAFIQADFDKAMVSLQVTTPANAKVAKTLTDDEKLTALRNYVATIDELTRQRSGVASELKRLTKEQSIFMRSFAGTPEQLTQLIDYAMRISALQTQADTAS